MVQKIDMLIELDDGAQPPEKAHELDACYDLFSNETVTIRQKDDVLVDTGVHIRLPKGLVGKIWPRSGLDSKERIGVGAGVIDPGYTGPVKVLLVNRSEREYRVEQGDRIAQIGIMPVVTANFVLVDELPETERSVGGFGSTGK